MKKLRIGIVGNIFTMESGLILGLERAYVNDDYIRAVESGRGCADRGGGGFTGRVYPSANECCSA